MPAPPADRLPAAARAHLQAGRSVPHYQPYATATWRIVGPRGHVRYLKAGWADAYPSVVGEAERARWLAGRGVPVPAVVDAGSADGVEWLVTEALEGRPATAAELVADPRRLILALADGLRAFHATDPTGCPFDHRPAAALAHARDRVTRGQVGPDDLHAEHAHLTVGQALARLQALAPERPRDVVVCHGDYCPPNVLLAGGRVAGYLDVGEAGLGERWRDLAVATWSVTWTLGPGHEDAFLDAYGVGWDRCRRDFYRLLYDLES